MATNVCLSVGIPSSGRPVAPEWAFAMMLQTYPSNTSVGMMLMFGHEVGDARNRLVEEAQKSQSEFLWMLDDDTAPPHFAAAKLIYEMRQNPEIAAIGGIYCMKSNPPDPTVYRSTGHGSFYDWAIHDVFEVTGIGTGCLMVRMSVFDTLPRPWFATTLDIPDTPNSDIVSTGMSDDLYFCDKLVNTGHRIYAHGGILCDHWDPANRTKYFLPPDSLPYRNFETGRHAEPMKIGS